jgi:hypothetical protein
MGVPGPIDLDSSPASARSADGQGGKVGVVTLTLRPVPAGRDDRGREPEYRLKIGLKRLWRDYGLRCVSVRTD